MLSTLRKSHSVKKFTNVELDHLILNRLSLQMTEDILRDMYVNGLVYFEKKTILSDLSSIKVVSESIDLNLKKADGCVKTCVATLADLLCSVEMVNYQMALFKIEDTYSELDKNRVRHISMASVKSTPSDEDYVIINELVEVTKAIASVLNTMFRSYYKNPPKSITGDNLDRSVFDMVKKRYKPKPVCDQVPSNELRRLLFLTELAYLRSEISLV